jgi:transglutaminase-like putative cysteine protease
MRIGVHHSTLYRYEADARSIVQVLRVTPRSHAGQQVLDWRLDADADVRLRVSEDAFGNVVHHLSTENPVRSLTLTVSGVVSTIDTAGVVQGTDERLPPLVYLRGTGLTEPTARVRAFAAAADPGPSAAPLDRLHALLAAVNATVAFDTTATDVSVSADQALQLGRGVCQDMSHVFVAAARHCGFPARYVSGHLVRSDGQVEQEAAHAWAEALVEGLGWVGFDAANGVCPTAAYVRVAIGLDYLDAAPVRGARSGGGVETLSVRLAVGQAQQ